MAHEIGMPGKPQKARLRRRAALRANSTMAPDMRLFRVSARKQSRRKRLASERSSQNVLWGHDRNRPLGIQVAPATCGYTKVLRPSMTTVSSFTFPTQAQIIAGAGADGK